MTKELTASLLLLKRELSRRQTAYPPEIEAGRMTRDEANHRHCALQTAGWLLGGHTRPARETTREQAMDELKRWAKELQRGATYETVGRVAQDMIDIAVVLDELKKFGA